MNPEVKRLREQTGYAWRDCIEAVRQAAKYPGSDPEEFVSVICRRRLGIATWVDERP